MVWVLVIAYCVKDASCIGYHRLLESLYGDLKHLGFLEAVSLTIVEIAVCLQIYRSRTAIVQVKL